MRVLSVSLLALCATVASAQGPVFNKRTGQYDCTVADGVFCDGSSLETSIIIQCNGTIGVPSDCNSNLALQFPLGGSSSCWAVPGEDGFSACEKNGILYGDSGNIGGIYSIKGVAPTVTRTVCPTTTPTPTSSPAQVVYTTIVTSVFTTVCPSPTTFVVNSQTYIVTASTTITITNCPCTLTKPVAALPPQATLSTIAQSIGAGSPPPPPQASQGGGSGGSGGGGSPANGNSPVSSGAPAVIPGVSEATTAAPAATKSSAAPAAGQTTPLQVGTNSASSNTVSLFVTLLGLCAAYLL